MKRPMKITTLIMATIAFATTALAGQPIQAQTTAQLQSRRAEIQRKFAEDDFGVYIGPIRWFSHGAERNGVRKELKAIDNELARRNGGGCAYDLGQRLGGHQGVARDYSARVRR